MGYCGDGERLFPPCSRGQDDPSAWSCLKAEIDKVQRRSVLDRARVCTEPPEHLFHDDLEREVRFSTLESGPGK